MNSKYKVINYALLTLVVFFIVLFYFFAKGVNIIVLPLEAGSNAKVTLTSGLGFSFNERYIFFPGEKRLRIESPGFYDQELTLNISDSSDLVTVNLKELPGKVKFNITPNVLGKLFLGNELISPKEGFYDMPAGKNQIVYIHPMFLKYTSSIEVVGKGVKQEYSLELKPNWATLSISSSPDNAEVYVSGDFIGNTPIDTKVITGLHELIYRKDGYRDLTKVERVQRGVNKILETAKLELLPGTLQLTSNPSAVQIFVNGKFFGKTPASIELQPDQDHLITLEADGFISESMNFNLSTQEFFNQNFNLAPSLGRVLIDANLPSKILLNNKFLANTPFEGDLQTIEGDLEIQKAGYRSYKTKLKPKKDFITNINASLITEEKARFQESPKNYVTKGGNNMVLLSPSPIVMGAKRSEKGQRANETIRKVDLTKPFYMSVHEVTNSQYLKFKSQNSINQVIENNDLPLVDVSWNDAALYCNWLSKHEGFEVFYKVQGNKVIGFNLNSHGYRLPTESEWSWAARKKLKQEDLKFPWGYRMPVKEGSGNFADTSVTKSIMFIPDYTDGFAELAPVGSFEPNQNGIYDLGGNVSEFVNDYYSIMIESNRIYKDFTGPKRGTDHVIKGSSWRSANITELRFSYRDKSQDGGDNIGFRVARWLVGKGDLDD